MIVQSARIDDIFLNRGEGILRISGKLGPSKFTAGIIQYFKDQIRVLKIKPIL